MTTPDFITVGPLQHLSIGPLQIPTYYLVISLACCISIFWSSSRAQKHNLSLDTALNINALVLIVGFFGARLFHIFYEAPLYYKSYPIEALYFWQGGFVFLGGALAGYFAAVTYLKKKGEPLWEWHDTFAPVVALGYAIGRFACFLHGCCYGKVCDLPWAQPLKQTHIHTQITETLYRHPTTLYIAFWELGLVALLIYIEKKTKAPGQLFFIALFFHSLGRILMEMFRADPRGPTLGSLSLSMGLSLVFMIVSFSKLRTFQLGTK